MDMSEIAKLRDKGTALINKGKRTVVDMGTSSAEDLIRRAQMLVARGGSPSSSWSGYQMLIGAVIAMALVFAYLYFAVYLPKMVTNNMTTAQSEAFISGGCGCAIQQPLIPELPI